MHIDFLLEAFLVDRMNEMQMLKPQTIRLTVQFNVAKDLAIDPADKPRL